MNASNQLVILALFLATPMLSHGQDADLKIVRKTEREWKECLSPEAYQILRNAGTERAFTGKYYLLKDKGIYQCAGCRLPLFSSDTKYDSGTGWPSFWKPVQRKNIKELQDFAHGMVRVEIRCARCDGHIGHVFDDGPNPTGLRYCMNSDALHFVQAEDKR